MTDLRIALTADPEGGWTPLAFLGAYSDPGRFGDFAITAAMVASWQRGLQAGVVTGQAGMVAIDVDHSSESTGSTLAAGWIREIRLVGDKVEARVEWTDRGRELVASGQYKFLSPTFAGRYLNDQGQDVGPTLTGAAITNKPFIRTPGVMAISLSALETARLEQRVAQLCQAPGPPSVAPPTPDVTAGYRAWALSTGFGGDVDGALTGRVHAGRAELHQAVLRRLAERGDDAYADALDEVLAMAAAGTGTVKLSSGALEGTNVQAPAPGWRDRADVQLPDPARSPQYLDTCLAAEGRQRILAGEDPATVDVGTGVGRRSEQVERRHRALVQLSNACGETLAQTIDRLAREG